MSSRSRLNETQCKCRVMPLAACESCRCLGMRHCPGFNDAVTNCSQYRVGLMGKCGGGALFSKRDDIARQENYDGNVTQFAQTNEECRRP